MKTLTALFSVLCIALASCTSTTQKDSTIVASQAQTPTYIEASLSSKASKASHLYITAPSGLSLREGTNLKSKKMLTIPYGSQVSHLSSPEHTTMTVAGIKGDMVQVNYQGATGFVFSGYLSTLSPPLESETVSNYAKRLSTPENEIRVSKVKSAKGDAYGLTTSIELPAKSWGEAYLLAQSLFDIPKSISVDMTNSSISSIVNNKKRLKTKTDEVTLGRDAQNSITHITYSYALRDYTRTVSITKSAGDYLITEAEVSL